MAYYASGFSGPISCTVLYRENSPEYITECVTKEKIHFSRLSCHIRVKITARKHSAYKYGEIITVFAMDIFDTVSPTKSGYRYHGKEWAHNVPIQDI
jgi:hypothetical protein